MSYVFDIVRARGQNLLALYLSVLDRFLISIEPWQPRALLDQVYGAALSKPGLPGLTMHCSHTAGGMVSGNFTDFHLLCLNIWGYLNSGGNS